MYQKFRLINFKMKDFDSYTEIGENFYSEKYKREINQNLDNFLNKEGDLEGNKIIENWFREEKFDIFLSHSHKDKELALGIAGFLNKEFKLKVFIDSQVWGYVDELLKKIDNKYCYQKNTETYNYQKRNISTAHVHLMLNNAFLKDYILKRNKKNNRGDGYY